MAEAKGAAGHFTEGEVCIRQGRTKDGIAAYQTGLALDPDNSNGWYNLGYLLRSDRQFLEAKDAYQEALRRGVRGPQEVWLNIAVIEFDYLNQPQRATAALRQALDIDPDFIPALLNLGTVFEEMGEAENAVATYAKVLQRQPENGRALGRSAMMALGTAEAGQWVDRLKGALKHAARAAEDRAEIAFALGHLLDGLGSYQDAFQAFQAANSAARQRLSLQSAYVPAQHEQLVSKLIAQTPPAKAPQSVTAKDGPIFIFGMFRSGSTLVEQILGRHPDVAAGGELEFIPATARDMFSPYPETLAALNANDARSLRAAYLRELTEAGLSAPRTTDKRPDNVLYLPLIHALFPEAPLIMTRRNPADTALSVYFGNFDVGVPYGFDLSHIAHWSRQFDRLRRHWAEVYAGQILECDYDRLVHAPREVVTSLTAHCGLGWDEACLTPTTSAAPVRTLSNWQVRQPIHTASSQRWRNYEAFLPDDVKALAAL